METPEQKTESQVIETQKPRKHGEGWAATFQSLTVTLVIAVFVITFVVQAFQIPSESMENTLLIGDYLLVDKIHFGPGGFWQKVEPFRPIRRGDIIVFRYPVNPAQHFVKRVVGLPGDRVKLRNKQVWVNGVLLRESYVVHKSPEHDMYRDEFPDSKYLNLAVTSDWWGLMPRYIHGGELQVPPNQYFVLGDNRDQSLDSRYWGFVPRENIIGRPLVIYWSMEKPDHLTGSTDRDPASDKLQQFTYILSHLFEETRWDRTFRLIK